MKTIKLYDADAYISEFKAKVLKCEAEGKYYNIILDQTAFFPEGGGQPSDTGFIGTSEIVDVQLSDGVIYHKTDSPLLVGEEVTCKLDWDVRFRRMQNHSGEHLVSGIANRLYGCTNVGFRMGKEITVDFDVELTAEQIRKIEKLANEAVYKNVAVYAEYPDKSILEELEYRSKLDLTEDVRIVTIEGYDRCACCAPHINRTGEIGIIKILGFMRHRGGTRLFMLCGFDAYEDYCIKADNLYQIAVALCAKHNEELPAFKRLCDENSELKQKCSALTKELTQLKSEKNECINGITVYFENEPDMQAVRKLALEAAKKNDGIVAVFSGENNSYKYAVSSLSKSVKSIAQELNASFNGRGGGSDELVQGSIVATDTEIRKLLSEIQVI